VGDWGPASSKADEPDAVDSNTALGLKLFSIYTAVYFGYAIVSAFRPDWMANTVGGVNLAVWSGFVLILGAIAMAALYLWLCRPSKRTTTK
jgi:uncharacterized membrane protein (DUF485 family)